MFSQVLKDFQLTEYAINLSKKKKNWTFWGFPLEISCNGIER